MSIALTEQKMKALQHRLEDATWAVTNSSWESTEWIMAYDELRKVHKKLWHEYQQWRRLRRDSISDKRGY